MKHTFLDIETTGFNREVDVILSVGYLTMNDDFTKVLDADVMYFYREGQRDSSPEALQVHGLTKEFLMQFEADYTRNLQKLFKIFKMGSLIGHYITTFDEPFVKAFLRRNGYGMVEPFQVYDTAKIYQPLTGRISLTNLMTFLKVPLEGVSHLQSIYFKSDVIRPMAHDATYDTTAAMIAFCEAKRRGLV